MRITLSLAAAFLVGPFVAIAPTHPVTLPVVQEVPMDLHGLAFMAGCWRGEPDERGTVIEEQYTSPSDNLILGTTRYLREGRTISFEFARIAREPERVVLVPYPNGSPSSDPFALTRLEPGDALFEAPEHDFPRRIRYRLDPDGALVARIDDGTDDGQAHSWRMHRVECGR